MANSLIQHSNTHGINRQELYYNALTRAVQRFSEAENRKDLYGAIYYCVRFINSNNYKHEEDVETLACALEIIGMIINSIKQLTPNELIQLFPVQKDYDGHVYCTVDYHSTMECLAVHGMDNILGEEAEDILSEYHNGDLRTLQLNEFRIGNKLTQQDGR